MRYSPRMNAAQEPSKTFGERVKELRERRGISQRELVEALERLGVPMHQPGIARIQKGTRKVSLEELFAIAAVFDVPPESLYWPPLDTWEEYDAVQMEVAEDPGISDELARLRVWKRQREKEKNR
jgi:transcriptional regulator with XRE-family HTH domain